MVDNIKTIREHIIEQSHEAIDLFISKQCFIAHNYFVTKSDFKKELLATAGHISQKILSSYMTARGVKTARLSINCKQQACWVGLRIGIRI